jgi:hypothetical protein
LTCSARLSHEWNHLAGFRLGRQPAIGHFFQPLTKPDSLLRAAIGRAPGRLLPIERELLAKGAGRWAVRSFEAHRGTRQYSRHCLSVLQLKN